MIDHFIPDHVRNSGPEAIRRARICIGFAIACSFWSPVFSSVYYFGMQSAMGGSAIVLAGLGGLSVPFLLKRTGNIVLCGNYTAFILSSVLTIVAWLTGGEASPPMAWKTAAVPMVAMCVAGKRSGIVWAGLSIVEILAYYLLDHFGVHAPDLITASQMKFLRVTVFCGHVLCVLSLTLIYEVLKEQTVKSLEESAEEIARAKDAAEAASRAKSAFLANMSHELRTPLHGILSYASFGRRESMKAPKEKLQGYFVQVHESGQRLLGLLNNLLDLSKLEADKMKYNWKEGDLAQSISLVQAEFSGYAKEKGLYLFFDTPQCSTRAVFDEERIIQVLRNLVSNAIKFSNHGSTIRILAEEATERDAPAVAVSVLNLGVGIPDNELEMVFDKFVQSSKTRSNSGGTGLGLAICREIVTAHGGRIFARNETDARTRFTFTVPVARQTENELEAAA